jgi:hypothetical protein
MLHKMSVSFSKLDKLWGARLVFVHAIDSQVNKIGVLKIIWFSFIQGIDSVSSLTANSFFYASQTLFTPYHIFKFFFFFFHLRFKLLNKRAKQAKFCELLYEFISNGQQNL